MSILRSPFEKAQDYVNNNCFKAPLGKRLVYYPTSPCTFSAQGEEMVHELVRVSTSFRPLFDIYVSKRRQSMVANEEFQKRYKEAQQKKIQKEMELKQIKEKELGYYSMNRTFDSLVAYEFLRTKAPRLTARGNSFHGMQKGLKSKILCDLSGHGRQFIDIDMSACHSRIASYLILNSKSQIGKSLEGDSFWKDQITWATPYFKKRQLDLDAPSMKSMLKIMLYTSLNGGNPASEGRVLDNIGATCKDYLRKKGVLHPDQIVADPIFEGVTSVAKDFALANELKDLNKRLVWKGTHTDTLYTFTLDRVKPYTLDSIHLGISRVLQGFEVVLLSVLVKAAMEYQAYPVSLDHDGILVSTDDRKDPKELVSKINQQFLEWTQFLLHRDVPLEIKTVIRDGKVQPL